MWFSFVCMCQCQCFLVSLLCMCVWVRAFFGVCLYVYVGLCVRLWMCFLGSLTHFCECVYQYASFLMWVSVSGWMCLFFHNIFHFWFYTAHSFLYHCFFSFFFIFPFSHSISIFYFCMNVPRMFAKHYWLHFFLRAILHFFSNLSQLDMRALLCCIYQRFAAYTSLHSSNDLNVF